MDQISQNIGSYLTPEHCLLGLSNAIECLPQASSSFTLGEGIGAVALIFAVFALLNKKARLILKIRSSLLEKSALVLAVFGIFSVALAFLLPFLPLETRSLFKGVHAGFFELLAYVLFVTSASILYFGSRFKQKLFSFNDTERCYNLMISAVAQHDNELTSEVIDVIYRNLKDLLCLAKGADSVFRKKQITNKKERNSYFAFRILNDILTDTSISQVIVVGRIDFITNLFVFIKENDIPESVMRDVVNKIIFASFSNRDSFLYKHLENEGLAKFISIYDVIFASPYILHEFSPFDALRWGHQENADEQYAEVYIKALKTACETFYENKEKYINERTLIEGFEKLNQIIEHILFRRKLPVSEISLEFSPVERFLENEFPQIYAEAYKNKKILNDDNEYLCKMDVSDKFFHAIPQSVSSAYVLSVYKTWEVLSNIKFKANEYETIRLIGMQTAYSLIRLTRYSGYDNLSKRFSELITKKMIDNVENLHFPPLMKTMFVVLGTPVMKGASNRKEFVEYAYSKLYDKILEEKTMGITNKKIDEVLLPPNVSLDKENKIFYYHDEFGGKEVIKVEEEDNEKS